MEPWRDCAPCHPLSDGGAGKRYANLVLINRPDQGLLNSRRMDRRRFPTASGPSVGAPHPCRWIASGLSEAPSTRNPPCPSPPRSILSRYSTVTTCFGGFGLEERREIVGDFELNVAFRFGGIPLPIAERSLKLFAKEVLPVLKSW